MSDFEPTIQQHQLAEGQRTDAVRGWEQNFTADSREHGRVSSSTLLKIGAVLAIPALVGAWAHSIGMEDGKGPFGLNANDSSSHGEATSLVLDPMELDCSAVQIFDVSGSVFKAQMEWNGHEIPQFGGDATFENPTKIALSTCEKDKSAFAASIVLEDEGPADPETGIRKKVIKIPVSTIVVNAQYPTGNKHIVTDAYTGMKAAGILGGIGSIGVKGVCVTLSLNQADCDGLSKKIDSFKRDFDSNMGNTAEESILKFVKEQGSTVTWQDTKLAMRDKYIDQALKKNKNPKLTSSNVARYIDVEFVDDAGKETTATPDFAKDVFEAYRKSGVLADDATTKFDTTHFKIIKPTPYKPKYALGNQEPSVSATTTSGSKQ